MESQKWDARTALRKMHVMRVPHYPNPHLCLMQTHYAFMDSYMSLIRSPTAHAHAHLYVHMTFMMTVSTAPMTPREAWDS